MYTLYQAMMRSEILSERTIPHNLFDISYWYL